MALKEMYEEMSDEELLERYKDIEKYFETAQETLINEIRKRKLVGEKEIEKKLDSIKKYEEEKTEEKKKVERKCREINENDNQYFYFPLAKEMVRLRGYYTLHLAAHLALLGWIIFSISIIINSFSLFFKTTDGIIVKIENRKITYQYNLDGENIVSDKTTLMDSVLKGSTSKLGIGSKIAVYYSPFFKNKSVLIRGADTEMKVGIVLGYLIVCFLYILSYARLKKKYLLIGLYIILFILIMPGSGIKILEY